MEKELNYKLTHLRRQQETVMLYSFQYQCPRRKGIKGLRFEKPDLPQEGKEERKGIKTRKGCINSKSSTLAKGHLHLPLRTDH